MEQISVLLDESLKHALEAAAVARGVEPSLIVQEALIRHLGEEDRPEEVESENAYEMAVRLGIVGCIDGTPPDLSTNPTYYEGFGRV